MPKSVTTEPMPLKKSDFPSDFRFGAATAAYQIEGAATEDGRLPSIWDTFSHTQGKTKHGDTGDIACDHYHLWQTDLDLMRTLGLNAYRFSIAWPRIIPTGRGAVNPAGLDFYDRLVDGLLARGIDPFVTLYHWDLPQSLQDKGGWLARDTTSAFVDYANVVAKRLGDRVASWMTFNEPWCTAFLGHMFGNHAPGEKDIGKAALVSHHLLLAHGLATQSLRALLPKARIGIVLNLAPMHPARPTAEDQATARHSDGMLNRWLLDPLYGRGYPEDMMEIRGSQTAALSHAIQPDDFGIIATATDFLGVNYYQRSVVQHQSGSSGGHHVKPPGEYTQLGWEVYPDGLREILVRVHRDYRPPVLYVAENGAAYADVVTASGQIEDESRRSYIERHMISCRNALNEGVPLKGYFVWSLLDNFEWAEGYEPRFGIVHVDFATQKRTIKKSGHWLTRLLASPKA